MLVQSEMSAQADIAAVSRPSERIVRMLTGFGALHATHTALNLAFTLVQLLVLARGLDQARYAEIVFLTAVGVYFQPLDQAIGRANYVTLRPSAIAGAEWEQGEVVALLYAQALLLTVVSFAVPLSFGVDDPVRYLGNALYLFGCVFTNFWSYDLQSTVWSADLGRPFALISIVRRVLFFVGLWLFWVTGEFLLFGLFTTAVILAFTIVLVRMVARHSRVFRPVPHRGAITRAGIVAHLKQFWTSLLSALSELLVLNSPYAVLTAIFGVGPVLVAFDSVMKVGRLAMAGTRTLAEIFLPRISRQFVLGRPAEARRGILAVTAVCVLATAIPAGAIYFFAPLVFDLLLGHNNVVPPEAATAAALVVLITGLYQPAVFFLSYLNADIAIRRLTLLALLGFLAYAAAIYLHGAEIIGSLWIYGAFFAVLSAAAVWAVFRYEPKTAGGGA